MGQIASLITQKLNTTIEAGDWYFLRSKYKAITALLPCAVWWERDGRPEMLDTILHAARASGRSRFMWFRIHQFVSPLLFEASPRAVILTSPHTHWDLLTYRGDLIQHWAATVSVVPHTEEIAQSVVDTLLQIASQDELLLYIPVDLWSWLTKRPSLPPICEGRYVGTRPHVVEAVRALKDVQVLKSYLLLVWSELVTLPSDGFVRMCTSIREDFGGIGMGHHRADLVQHLDRVLEQLDKGLEYLKQRNPKLNEGSLRGMKYRYGVFKRILLETNLEAITRMSYPIIVLLYILTRADVRRIPHNIYVRASPSMSIASYLELSTSLIPPPLLHS